MMTKIRRSFALDRALMVVALAIAVIASGGQVASAQDVRPPANAVKNATPKADANEPGGRGAVPESDLWGGIRKGAQGSVSIPDKKAGVLVQSGGETWRNFRNGPLVTYGAWAMGGMLALLTLFFLVRGRIKIEHGWSGRTIERFQIPTSKATVQHSSGSSVVVLVDRAKLRMEHAFPRERCDIVWDRPR